jgi:hypothetical protein
MYLHTDCLAVAQKSPSGNDILLLCGIYFLHLKTYDKNVTP